MKSLNLHAQITSLRAKADGSLGMNINTPELSPEQKTLFFQLQNINLDLTMTPLDEKAPERIKINTDLNQKTPSQRLRNTLYVLFNQNNEGYGSFEPYYNGKMEKIIEYLKGKIEE